MMKHAPVVALALVGVLVAGCGGGSSITKEDAAKLQEERDAALAAEKAAEAARKKAEQEAAAARERADAAAAAAEEQRKKQAEALAAAEAEKKKLEDEAKSTADQLLQANARRVLVGLTKYLDSTDDTDPTQVAGTAPPAVTPRHGQSALVTTTPVVTFSTITPGASGKWYKTSLSHRAFTVNDRLDVYTDAEAPKQVSFSDSVYNDGVTANEVPNTSDLTVYALYDPSQSGTTVIDSQGKVVGSLQVGDSGGKDVFSATASPFPKSGDPAKSFTLVDRGKYTTEQRRRSQLDSNHADYLDPSSWTNDDGTSPYTGKYRNADRYPLRYTYEQSGSLSGAGGMYTCASATATTSCRVTNQNDHFRFVGPWVFTPSSSAKVRVEDAEFMYFGWWARETNPGGAWTFRTFHGPTGTDGNGNRSSADEISQLSGTATYKGPAVGYYSFYQPQTTHSEYGEFSAKATLTANFTSAGDGSGAEEESVHGSIDQFVDHPDWTLTLKQTNISGGLVPSGTNSVSWSIKGEATAAPDSGTWEAAFYSNLPDSKRGGAGNPNEDATPTGMAGTFEAKYHHVGAIIGAFGAHKQP